jgi:hypothetical protein
MREPVAHIVGIRSGGDEHARESRPDRIAQFARRHDERPMTLHGTAIRGQKLHPVPACMLNARQVARAIERFRDDGNA